MAKKIKQINGYVPIEIIESALNEGIMEIKSEQLMKYFEMLAGHRIYIPKPIDNQQFKEQDKMIQEFIKQQQPKVAPTAPKTTTIKPVVSAPKLPAFMDPSLKFAEIYKKATDEVTKLKESSDVLQKKNYGSSLAARYKEWMTPELFDYLSMKGPRAEAEFRAACYPARVSFSHRVQKIEGRMWATPYITIFAPSSAFDSKDDYNTKLGETAYSFYLTKDREIHVIKDDVKHIDTIKSPETRDKQRAENMKIWQKSEYEKRVRIVNPKTGVEQFALLKSRGTEGWQEKYYFKKPNAYQWPQVYDVNSFIRDGNVDFDEYWGKVNNKASIEAMGREAISKIPSIVMSKENLSKNTCPIIFDYDKKGNLLNKEAPKGWEVYTDDGISDFSRAWNQEDMEKAVDWYNQDWGK